jgi:Glycosyltransferase WbsX
VRFFTFFPQFCPEPLNDDAWGKGFTDWDLIRQLPGSIAKDFTPEGGFYNPNDSSYLDTLQTRVTEVAGPDSGLMVYHYFFDGLPVLSGFEQAFLKRNVQLPFFFCWANESWTKRWNGQANEYIVKQRHLLDQEVIQKHVQYLSEFMRSPHYFTWQSRPLLVIYDPHTVVHMNEVLKMYRAAFAAIGSNPLFGACLSYPQQGLEALGFDLAIEFQPRYFFNLRRSKIKQSIGLHLKQVAPALFDRFAATIERLTRNGDAKTVYQYGEYLDRIADGTLERSLRKSAGDLPLIRSGFLGWDNLPRYKDASTKVDVHHLTANELTALSSVKSDANLPLIINSWNEWSEGAAFEKGLNDESLKNEFLRIFNQ